MIKDRVPFSSGRLLTDQNHVQPLDQRTVVGFAAEAGGRQGPCRYLVGTGTETRAALLAAARLTMVDS